MRTVTDTFSLKVNWLAPINLAAIYFGGKWVLSLLGISTTWGQYTGAAGAALLVWFVANLNYSTTWTRRRKRTYRG